ncbi:MAG: YraN family protein [Paludibacteraceae bacterium]|nr:YraN family protein [Paludibacteraceae bacterium]
MIQDDIHNWIGRIGEEKAAQVMKDKGFSIREVNWKMGHLEMDIIAENKKEIVFVEVKTRTTTFGGKLPEENVDIIKQKRLIAAGNAYIKMYHLEKAPRFDIIGLIVNREGEFSYVNHLENAFVPHVRTINSNSFTKRWSWKHRGHIIK